MEEEHFYDEERFQTLLSCLDISLPQELRCPSNNMICRMCTNPTCTMPALVCNDLECDICGEDNH